ncbi:TonB-dependent receptor [Sphingomonas flavalba]|uniref:TonB-dependent receptor n=1 Tax=Sphingomonas flavalba TaxID=2559804 RepID=UPI0039DFDF2D
MKKYVSKGCGIAALAVCLAYAASASAQTGGSAGAQAEAAVPDIVVTAQRRAENLQDVPIAVTALDAGTLETNRIVDVRDLDGSAPNLTVRAIVGGSSLPSYSMRGSVSFGAALGADRSVALYVDGVYIGNGQGSIFDIGDIERIEVLRGPQGTLFGRNATGGAISVTTPQPTGTFGIKHTTTVGNYDQFRSVTRLDSPAYGPFSFAVNYMHSERRGDIRNIGGGTTWDFTSVGAGIRTSPDYLGGFNTDAATFTGKLDFDKLNIVYRFEWSNTHATSNGQGIVYLSPTYQTIFNAQPDQSILTPVTNKRPDAVNNWGALPRRLESFANTLTATYDVSSNLTFKNIATYRITDLFAPYEQIDGAGGLLNTPSTGGVGAPGTADVLFGLACRPAGISAAGCVYYQPGSRNAPLSLQTSTSIGKFRQFSNEFQTHYNSDFIDLTGGLYYFQLKQITDFLGVEGVGLAKLKSSSFLLAPNFTPPNPLQPRNIGATDSMVRSYSKAAYAQAEVHITDQFDIIAGGRYTHDLKKGVDRTVYSSLNRQSGTGGVFPVYYKHGEFTYNLGVNYKIDHNVLLYAKYVTGFISGGQFASLTYNPEKARSLEAGVKADLFDRRLRLNTAVFTVDYDDLQFTTIGSNIGRPDLSQVLLNAGDARARGFEAEATVVPTYGLTLRGSVGYTDFKYKSLNPAVTAGTYTFLVHERPKWTGNVSAAYEVPIQGDLSLSARVDGSYRSASNGTQSVPGTPRGFSAAESERYIAAQRIPGYWLWNGRLALQGLEVGGVESTLAVWGRNIFNNRSVSQSPSLTFLISADYQRAATYGLDWTIKF